MMYDISSSRSWPGSETSTSGTGAGGCFAIFMLAMAAPSTVATAGSSLLLRRLLAPGLLFLVKLSSRTGRLRRLDIIRANALPVANATSTAACGGACIAALAEQKSFSPDQALQLAQG